MATYARNERHAYNAEVKNTMVLQVRNAQVFTLFWLVSLPPSDVLRLRSAESSRAKDGPFVTTGVWNVNGLGSMLESPRPKPHSG